MKRTLFIVIFIASAFLFSCKTQVQEYEKKVVFEPGTTLEQKVKQAAHVVPTPQQLDWQKLEMTAFHPFHCKHFYRYGMGTWRRIARDF